MSKHVEDVKDRSNTPKGCNAMYVEDVEDRSNTPKGCNAMLCMSKMSKMHSIECIEYCTKDQSNVEDVEDRSNTPKGCNAMYVGDVEDRSNTPKGCNAMLCMSKMSKMHSIECIEYCTKDQSNVEDVKDRSNTPKGCNAMYVGDVEDGKRIYTHILAHNFLNT